MLLREMSHFKECWGSVTAVKNNDRKAAVMRFRQVIAACTKGDSRSLKTLPVAGLARPNKSLVPK